MRRLLKILVRFLLFLALVILLFGVCIFVFKDSLLLKAQKSIANQLNTEIKISELDISPFSNLPQIGINANQINILDNAKEELFLAEDFKVSINPWDLLNDELEISSFSISNGRLKVIRNISGKWNYELNNKEASNESFVIDFPNIQLDNIEVLFEDNLNDQEARFLLQSYSGRLQLSDLKTMVAGIGTLRIDSINNKGVSYFYPSLLNVDLDIEQNEDELTINECTIKDDENKFNVVGTVKDEMALETEIKIVQKQDFHSFLDSTTLSMLPSSIEAKGIHKGDISSPSHHLEFQGKGIDLMAHYHQEQLRLDGTYQLGESYNYTPSISIQEGQLQFSNLILNLRQEDGVHSLMGSIGIKDFKLSNEDSDEVLLNAKEVYFSNGNVATKELKIETGKSDLEFNGDLFYTQAIQRIEGKLNSNYIDTDDFIKWIDQDTTSQSENTCEAELEIEVEQLKHQNWNAKIEKTKIQFVNNESVFDGVIKTCEGTAKLKGTADLNNSALRIQVEFDNIDVNQLLVQFDNFQQEVVTDKNLYGTINGAANLDFVFLEEGDIDPYKSVAKIALNASDGKLIDLELLQDFSTYVDAEELANVEFESMTNYFEWKDNRLQIPVLYIKNNAANFLISGFHDYDNRFAYNLQINAGEVIAKKLGKKSKAKRKGWWNMYYYVHGFPNDFKVDANKDLVQRNIESSFLDKENIFLDLIKTFGYNDILDQIEEWEDIPEYYDN